MDESRRRAYLNAMGITVWVPRSSAVPEAPSGAPASVSPESRLPIQPEPDPAPPPAVVPETPGLVPAKLGPPPTDAGDAALQGADTTALRLQTVSAMGWEPLRESVLSCTACALHRSRTQAVFGVGNPGANWMIVGEAPGADEDRVGEPFVGRAGKLLDKMLAAMGLDRSTVFIANILKCRPPQNRDPSHDEASACRVFLERQVELVAPQIILAVGRVSAQNLLGSDSPVGRLRGQVHRFGPRNVPLVVTYHPAYLLRRPLEKRKSWEDLKLAMTALREANT